MERNFAAVMSELRHARGLSQRKVAADLKISQALLSHYENGAREPGLAFVCRACDYYGVSADFLLGRAPSPRCTPEQLDLLTAPEEREIIRHLASLTDEIALSAKNYDPARITRYCIDLATLFHKFYNACRVNCDDKNLSAARIYLCLCVKEVLKNILTLLKISVPERM